MISLRSSHIRQNLPDVIPGFEHVDRYWDRSNQVFAAKILPGEFYVTQKGELIVTVLGSCVSACIRDRLLKVGGMNHFMLPLSRNGTDKWGGSQANSANRYGNFAMENLINSLMKQGARRDSLEVKLFGGGQILENMSDVGKKNIDFAMEYCRTEGLKILAEDFGGPHPRKVYFYPDTGRVRLLKINKLKNTTIVDREQVYARNLRNEPVSGDVDLF